MSPRATRSSLCLFCRDTRETQRTRSPRWLLLPCSGRVGAGRAAASAAVTSTAQRMRHRQVNIPLLRLLLGDWAPQLPLHGDPGRARGGSPPGRQPLRAAREESRVRAEPAAPPRPPSQRPLSPARLRGDVLAMAGDAPEHPAPTARCPQPWWQVPADPSAARSDPALTGRVMFSCTKALMRRE